MTPVCLFAFFQRVLKASELFFDYEKRGRDGGGNSRVAMEEQTIRGKAGEEETMNLYIGEGKP